MSAQTPRAPRLLVVDDEPSMRDMLRIVLRKDGYDVHVASNGREAVAALEHEVFDLLLTDIRLPDVDGVQVLREASGEARDRQRERNREVDYDCPRCGDSVKYCRCKPAGSHYDSDDD